MATETFENWLARQADHLTPMVDKLRRLDPASSMDDIENLLRFNGVTRQQFDIMDEKPGMWGYSGDWHCKVRELRNYRGYRGNVVTLILTIEETTFNDGSNPKNPRNGDRYFIVTTAFPDKQTDNWNLLRALEPGCVAGRAFDRDSAIRDYVDRFRDYSDAITLNTKTQTAFAARVDIVVHKNRNERN